RLVEGTPDRHGDAELVPVLRGDGGRHLLFRLRGAESPAHLDRPTVLPDRVPVPAVGGPESQRNGGLPHRTVRGELSRNRCSVGVEQRDFAEGAVLDRGPDGTGRSDVHGSVPGFDGHCGGARNFGVLRSSGAAAAGDHRPDQQPGQHAQTCFDPRLPKHQTTPSCGVRPGWCGGARTPLYRAVNRANGTNAHRVVALTPFLLPTSPATTHLVCEGWRPTATPAVHSSTTEEPAERNNS